MCEHPIVASVILWLNFYTKIIKTSCNLCEHMLQFHIVKALLPDMDGFPSGQRGQTVNLLLIASVVRIHLHPLELVFYRFIDAGWSSLEARRAHNPKVIGSNPVPAIICKPR